LALSSSWWLLFLERWLLPPAAHRRRAYRGYRGRAGFRECYRRCT
jgi:hypothetical protein